MKDFMQENMDEFLPLREVVFKTLRQSILTGELKPGERLMEIHLAEKLGVSRTPIREAIRKLELEGLVTMIPRRGAEVAKISEKNLKDVLEVRTCLDSLAVRLACQRITDEQIDDLKKACDDFVLATKTGEATAITKADVKLHDVIVRATGNERLQQMIHTLSEQMYRYRFEYIKDVSTHEQLIAEHRILFDCIRNKDKATAAKTAKLHIDNQENAIMRQLHKEQEKNAAHA